jgi:hypothetical protein
VVPLRKEAGLGLQNPDYAQLKAGEIIRGKHTSFPFGHKKSPRFNSKAFIYLAPPDGLEPPT